ncbi:efflux RND transporter permease subunit [Paradesulfitobacterium ferrireducens]|uniref:efflux RND transporter permease subunit n=1 Tax=Paradesulfitobacterium ferrireducens TaxID=2816476 RepID=UPI001A8CA562|nr:efflux RND transporter permease subunit [Paradesulfitobacterium ferrireducens]
MTKKELGLVGKVIKNRAFTIFFTILAILIGSYSYYLIPKQESPDVTPPFAIITSVYPGAAPEEVEKLVTRVIEDKVAEVPGYKTSYSYSKNSIAVVVLELNTEANVDKSWSDLRRFMDDAQRDLPAECGPIQVDTDLADTAGMIISLSGDGYSYEQLAAFADTFEKELSSVEGVSRFDTEGVQKKEVLVELRTADLNRYALSPEDVMNALKIQNMAIPSGSLSDGHSKINVTVPGVFTSLTDIENTVIDGSRQTGALVRLKDIANVRWETADSSYRIKQDGQNAILLSGYFEPNKNIVLIGKNVRTKLDSLKASLPPGLKVDEVTYQPQDVSQSVSNFFENLIEGIALVLVVVFFGMGLKNAVVASTAVPLSILIAFSAMYLLKIRVHEVSIAGLIIALGMLVDDAIVIIDSIQVYIDEGVEKFEACVKGTKRAITPMLAATITTAVAFAPMLFVPGPAGEFLQSLPQVVILSVSASFLVALLVTPVLSYIFFGRLKPSQTAKRAPVRAFYNGFLEIGMKHKVLTLVLTALSFAAVLYLGTNLKVMFFPTVDKNILYVDITAETAANLDNTERAAQQVEKLLSQQKEVLSYTTAIGGGLPKFYITLPKSTPSQDFAQIMFKVDLKRGGRFQSNPELAAYLQDLFNQNLVGGKAHVQLLQKAMPGTPLGIRISGDSREQIAQAVKLVHRELAALPGTMNVDDDLDAAEYEFKVEVDRDRASGMGVTNYDIQRQVNIALKGAESSVLRQAGNEYPIMVKSDIQSPEALGNLAIKSSVTKNKVLLKEFSHTTLSPQVPTIRKYDRVRSNTVSSEVQPGYSAVAIEQALKAKLAAHRDELKGVTLSYQGEAKDIKDNFGNLGTAAIFTLFAIYIILMLQFKSFLQPFIIFLTIPLSLIGVIPGLFLFRQPLSFTALVGVVSLMGVVIKNAILLIEFINQARAEGMSIREASFDAVSKRYRPIFLSAMTTVIGLVPLALSGSELFMPMSAAIMSGLTVSTLLTLVIIPVVYNLLHRENSGLTQMPDKSAKL